MRLILGRAYGETAPVKTFTDMFYADARLDAGAVLPMPEDHEDRGVYVIEGSVSVAGEPYEAGRMMVFRPGDAITLRAGGRGARLMLLGGDTLNGARYIWWNFVASSKDRIEAAKDGWRNGQFTLPPGDSEDFTPLPEK